jgi:hypothetical protein
MERPTVDVVVPVAGADAAGLRATVTRMRATLALGPGDTLTVVDNRGLDVLDQAVLVATEVRTSYYARNQGAARGAAEWLLFLDADVTPEPGLLDALFEPAPAPSVGVLAGAIVDAPPGPAAGVAVRFAALKGAMSQEVVLAHGRWAFAQTANAAVRRSAFTEAGGFVADVRSGGDADLCWRLRVAGWSLESRQRAAVAHANRARVGGLLAQRFRHGTGAGWLAARWPGALPARRWPGLVRWGLSRALAGTRAVARGDRDAAILGLLDGPAVWAFELGRLVPNRPLRRRWGKLIAWPPRREKANAGALVPLPPSRR